MAGFSIYISSLLFVCYIRLGNWDKLGYQYQEFLNLTIAKFNTDKFNPAKFYHVEKHPTLVLFQVNKEPIVYSGY